tara:strand:+ start:415 stop:1389 length:975 start_codon:yes stop_codon:yes gene_type:complete
MAEPSEAAAQSNNMDALLEDALADFDEAEEEVQARETSAETGAAAAAAPPSLAAALDNEALMLEAEELASQLMDSLNVGDTSSSVPAAPQTHGGGSDGMEDTLSALARNAEKLTRDDDSEGAEAGAAACMQILKQLGDMGLNGDLGATDGADGDAAAAAAAAAAAGAATPAALDGLLDNLVGQLLSKDVMLEPMIVLRDEFPKYLDEKGASLPEGELARYKAQQSLVIQIIEQASLTHTSLTHKSHTQVAHTEVAHTQVAHTSRTHTSRTHTSRTHKSHAQVAHTSLTHKSHAQVSRRPLFPPNVRANISHASPDLIFSISRAV